MSAYLKLHKSGELKKRAEKLWHIMEECCLCPRKCGVNRLKGEHGFCMASGTTVDVYSYSPHFGEERPLVGCGGSGTIFFTHCNLRCAFCQNFDISHHGCGSRISLGQLADMMISLQKHGCHNINFVTPSHYSAIIIKALDIAAGKGLKIPIVWNSSGWENIEVLKLLNGIVDIYLPDFKFWDPDISTKFMSGAESYPEITRQSIIEMNRQVGVLHVSNSGIASRGLIIRHLVMPNKISGSEKIIEWIAKNLPKNTYVNIMAQYTPQYKAFAFPEISRRISREEYQSVIAFAKKANLTNLDIDDRFWLI